MSGCLRKIIVVPVLLALFFAISAPVLTAKAAAIPPVESGCCNHDADESRDFAHAVEDCPFCNALSFDLTSPVRLNYVQTETQSLAATPSEPIPSPALRNIDQPPEHAGTAS